MKKISLPILILFLFVLVSCNDNSILNYNANIPFIPEIIENSPVVEKQFIENVENYYPLCRDGNTQYFWRVEEDNCVLYSMVDNETVERKIIVFTRQFDTITDKIIDLGICNDWIIASVGHHEGSANIFYGYFARLRKDGSDFERFHITSADNFFIVDDWIYYNFEAVEHKPENVYGCYRIRPDGTDKQYMGDKIDSIILYADDGYIYGEYDTGEVLRYTDWEYNYFIKDFIRCKPDGSGSVTLFLGDTLPKFDYSDSLLANAT